jgi:hypothetical protein
MEKNCSLESWARRIDNLNSGMASPMNIVTRLSLPILFIACITSCDPKSSELHESSRTYSPDGSKYILNFDRLVWDGFPTPFVTILNSSANVHNSDIKRSWSKWDIDTIYWRGNDTVIIEEPFIDYMTRGVAGLKDTTYDNVMVKVIQRDPIDSSYKKEIVYYSVSPDKYYELEVYKYVKAGQKNYYINVSIVRKGDKFPKYGDFYISPYDCICFTDIQWEFENSLVITANNRCGTDFRDYMVKGRPDIKYRIQFSDAKTGNIEQNAR